MMTSLDGYFEGPNHDLSWHHTDDEFNDFAIKQTGEVGTILFGRRTYEMMADYWSQGGAYAENPAKIVHQMNDTPKVAFSHSLSAATWSNTKLVSTGVAAFVRDLKKSAKKDLAIFGSNNLMVGLAELGLIDEFRIMLNPVAIGHGTSLFTGLTHPLDLRLATARAFKNGNLLLTYLPRT